LLYCVLEYKLWPPALAKFISFVYVKEKALLHRGKNLLNSGTYTNILYKALHLIHHVYSPEAACPGNVKNQHNSVQNPHNLSGIINSVTRLRRNWNL